MAGTWKGSALLTRYSQKYGMTDTTSLARVLEWINEVMLFFCARYDWNFLRFKLKKQFAADVQEIDISPQIPSAPTIAIAAGGSLTADSACYAKTTFVIYDETGLEENSIESQASDPSSVATPTGANLTLTVTGIDTYDGDTSIKPNTIYRRIYLKQGSGEYYLAATITNNTATTTSITTNPSTTIEPPEESMVECLFDADIYDEANNTKLEKVDFDRIKKFDPGISSSGKPQHYVPITDTKMLLWPSPSSAVTLSYYVKRKPSRIFNDSSRALQIPEKTKTLLDAGVTWKGYEYKDSDGQESKLNNLIQLSGDMFRSQNKKIGPFGIVREVE